MSSVTSRAEQALLGALLTQPHPAPGDLHTAVTQLREDDFGQRLHQHLFSAISYLAASAPELRGEPFIEAVATRVALPGAEPDRLRALATSAPNTAHAAAYARMIQTAAFRRQVARHAERIAATTATGGKHPATSPAARQSQEHQALLLAALTRQAQVYATLAGTPDSVAVTAASSPQEEPERAKDLTERPDSPANPAPSSRRAAQEDELLADLMANPEQAEALARFLPETTFSTDQRREIYQTMLMAAVDGAPIDEVIIAWTLEDNRALRRLYPPHDPAIAEPPMLDTEPGNRPGEPDIVYLTRLAATITVTSTAVQTGRQLLADDLCQHLTHSHAAADARTQITTTGGTPQPPPAAGPAPSPIPLDPQLQPPAPHTAQPGPTPTTNR